MDSIPSSISFSELASYLDHSSSTSKDNLSDLHGSFTHRELDEIAEDAVNSVIEIAPDPLVHKLMALKIMAKFVNWHNHYGQRLLDLEGPDSTSYMDWMNDAGILKASGILLSQVSVGTNDYISTEEDLEE